MLITSLHISHRSQSSILGYHSDTQDILPAAHPAVLDIHLVAAHRAAHSVLHSLPALHHVVLHTPAAVRTAHPADLHNRPAVRRTAAVRIPVRLPDAGYTVLEYNDLARQMLAGLAEARSGYSSCEMAGSCSRQIQIVVRRGGRR